jgi:hypothetical protein
MLGSPASSAATLLENDWQLDQDHQPGSVYHWLR